MNHPNTPTYLVLSGGEKLRRVIGLCAPIGKPPCVHKGRSLHEDIFDRVVECLSVRGRAYAKVLAYTYEIMSGLYDYEGSVSDDLSPAILELVLLLQSQLDEFGVFNKAGEMQYRYFPMPPDFPDIILKRLPES